MLSLRTSVGLLASIAIAALLPSLTSAQNLGTNAASTFFLDDTVTQFSLNIANDSNDVFIYFTSPAYSWVAVGFGEKMEGSLMFIMYPNDKGDNVTISPRIGSKSSEPTFTPDIRLDALPGTTVNDSMLILKARCHNCRTWTGGSLDTKSTAQPMIYAFGNAGDLNTNSPVANLRRHVAYGHFTMDLVAATGPGGIPAESNKIQSVKMVGTMVEDHDRKNLAHAVLGCFALFVFWPLNIILAGYFKNIKIHLYVSVVMMVFLVLSYALGIATSAEFNRSKKYNSPHQIMAFISLLPILLLSIVPIPRLTNLLPNLRSLHTIFTSATFVLLVLTGGLGLSLGLQARAIILGYTAVALVVFAFNTTFETSLRRRGSAYARANEHRSHQRESDREIILAKMRTGSSGSTGTYASKNSYGSTWGSSGSKSTFNTSVTSSGVDPAPRRTYEHPYAVHSTDFGGDGQRDRKPSLPKNLYGGGTMPGPQYLLNMHPGVPVQIDRM